MKFYRWSAATSVLATLFVVGCANRDIAVHNMSSVTLAYYGVVTNPPPPRRAPMPANDIVHMNHRSVDGDGFNPLYYVPGDPIENTSNGLLIQFSWDEPVTVLCRSMYYPVPPELVTSDPATQPTILSDQPLTPPSGDFTIEVRRGPNEELACTIVPGLP